MKKTAKISGLAYLMIFLAGFYANFAVMESLVDINNPLTTTNNIFNNHSQYGYGILGFLIMLFFDGLLIWSLFHLTKSVSRKGSLIASFFRFLHAIFFSYALLKLWNVYQLTLNFKNSPDLQKTIMKLILDFDMTWTLGLLFFGIHLAVLGYLAIKSMYIPSALGLLLILAAIGYIIDGLAKLFISNYSDYKDIFEVIVIMPSVIGEFSFTVWLLTKGFKKQALQQHAKIV